MNKRSRIWAILGATMLTLSVATVALAIELKEAHRGITISWDENGTAVVDGFDADKVNGEECDQLDLAVGDIFLHFVQSPTESDSGTLDVDFTGADDVSGLASSGGQGMQVDWDVTATATADTVVLNTANSSISDGELRVSHICVGDQPEEESQPPSEVPSEAPSEVPSAPPSEVPSQVIESEAPSEVPSQSVAIETDVPSESPFQSVEADTDAPSEPNTATVDGAGNVGAPGDGAWLLVVALGVLLASIVVLTPARAKAPRR
jgi:hypothetical protein